MLIREFVESGAALSKGARVAIITCSLILVGAVALAVYVLWLRHTDFKQFAVVVWARDRLSALVPAGAAPAFERFHNEPGPTSADVDDLDAEVSIHRI